jgi:hypothetical protein
MTQVQLDRAVARATGETVDTIQSRGFIFCSARPHRSLRRRRRRRKPKFVQAAPASLRRWKKSEH